MVRIFLLALLLAIPNICFAKKKRVLNLCCQGLIDVSNIEIPRRIRKLNLSFNKIQSVSDLTLTSNLQELNLFGNSIFEIDSLTLNDKLDSLSLGDNPIISYEKLEELNSLKQLGLSFSKLNNDDINLNTLSNNLEILEIPGNFFTELNLASLKKLRSLNIKGFFSIRDGGTSFDLDYSKVLLPDSLKEILIGSQDYVDDFTELNLPDGIESIVASSSGMTVAELFTLNLPPNLKKLRLKRNSITTLDGIEFPETLRVLNLQLNPIADDKAELKKLRQRLGKKVKILTKCGKKCSNSF